MSTGLDAPFHVLIVSFTTFTYGLAINNESESCSSVSNCKNFKFTEKEKANFEYLKTIAREIIEEIENINQKKDSKIGVSTKGGKPTDKKWTNP